MSVDVPKSLGLGLSLETHDNFLRVSVSVSKNLVSKKKSRYWYRKIWSRKKSLGIGLGKFGLGKKVSVLVSEKFVSDKKSRSRYRSKIWSRHTVPLCNKSHDASKIKQKFHISTLTNKVYDVEERKQFCSAVCFKASNFFKDQLETSPLWLREKDTPVFAKLYTGKQEAPKEKNVQLIFNEEKVQNNLFEKQKTENEESTVVAEQNESKRNKVGPVKEDLGALVTDALRSWFTIDSFRLVAGEERLREEVGKILQ